jgi:hypothetical protein
MDKYTQVFELKKLAGKLEQEALDEILDSGYIPTENDVPVTQYLRPDGRKRTLYAPLGKEYVTKAKNMACSAEELRTGQLVLYVRWDYQDDEDELVEFATNEPGDDSPNIVLKGMIDKLWDKRDV